MSADTSAGGLPTIRRLEAHRMRTKAEAARMHVVSSVPLLDCSNRWIARRRMRPNCAVGAFWPRLLVERLLLSPPGAAAPGCFCCGFGADDEDVDALNSVGATACLVAPRVRAFDFFSSYKSPPASSCNVLLADFAPPEIIPALRRRSL